MPSPLFATVKPDCTVTSVLIVSVQPAATVMAVFFAQVIGTLIVWLPASTMSRVVLPGRASSVIDPPPPSVYLRDALSKMIAPTVLRPPSTLITVSAVIAPPNLAVVLIPSGRVTIQLASSDHEPAPVLPHSGKGTVIKRLGCGVAKPFSASNSAALPPPLARPAGAREVVQVPARQAGEELVGQKIPAAVGDERQKPDRLAGVGVQEQRREEHLQARRRAGRVADRAPGGVTSRS